MSTRLQHRTALVTGATSNIGRAIATAFGAEGAHVIVSGRSERRGVEVVQTIRAAGGRADFIAAELDAEFGPAGVRVNAISPGVIRGPALDSSNGAAEHPAEAMMHGTPAGQSGTPEAVAHAAVYLASDEAAFVHGTVIDVDGGRVGVAVIVAS